jgi:transcriptional regulator with XRE-family HTH domain
MSMTLSSLPRRSALVADIDSGARRSRSADLPRRAGAPRGSLAPGAVLPRPGRAGNDSVQAWPATSPPGVIGGAVITAARRSAGLTRRTLARRLAVAPATVRAWETGALPLYCVSYDQLRSLARVVGEPGALAGLGLADLVLASQCDLLVAGMLGGFEDYAEVPPVDEEAAGEDARGLLRWALAGDVPDRYRPYAGPGPLLALTDVLRFMTLARSLAAGARGHELAGYGAALVAVAAVRHGNAVPVRDSPPAAKTVTDPAKEADT